jgi:superfamily I DNA/RNA helicase
MEVLTHRQSDFNKVLRQLRNAGSEATTAFNKIAQIQKSLELDEKVPGRVTDHGESRIRHAVKYKLTDNYRLVTIQTGGVCVFLFAGKHDDAEQWLNRHPRLEIAIHRKTGRIELIQAPSEAPKLSPNLTPTESLQPLLPLLEGIDWEEKVPSEVLREALLNINADTDPDRILKILKDVERTDAPFASYLIEVIDLLGRNKLTDARARTELFLGQLRIVEPENLIEEHVLAAPVNSDTFIRLGQLTEEARAIWEDPTRYQEWILFIHPDQRRVVDEDFLGPAILTGVSGSGKTCALLHRANRLATKYGERVLVVTLNHALADLLELMMQRLPGARSQRIEVMSYYEYIAALLEHIGMDRVLRVLADRVGLVAPVEEFRRRFSADKLGELVEFRDEAELRGRWDEFANSSRPGQSLWDELSRLEIFLHDQQQSLDARAYIREEFDLVRSIFRNIDEYQGYLEGYLRVGRSIALQAGRRRTPVLNLLREWEKWQIEKGFQDHLGLTQLGMVVLDDLDGELPKHLRYRSVLVDEFQDFSTLDLNLLLRIPTERENGLFLAGDVAQKVFAKEMNLESGIGRERHHRRITKNYRNTRQILEAAMLLLDDQPEAIRDGESEVRVLRPEYAERDGPKPFACKTDDPTAAAWAYAVNRLEAGYMAFSICIATANPKAFPVSEILKRAPGAIRAAQLTGSYILDPETVVVAELPDVKGFEFCLVVILGLEEGAFPSDASAQGERWRDALRLYVAMTRARDELRLIYQGKPSPFLIAMWPGLTPYEVQVDKVVVQSQVDEQFDTAYQPSPSFATAVLNGRSVIQVPERPTQSQLADALGTTPIQIANYAYEFGKYPTGTSRFDAHVVVEMFGKFGAVPLFVRADKRDHEFVSKPTVDHPRPVIRDEIPIHRCQQCGRTAIPGDSICYSCAASE